MNEKICRICQQSKPTDQFHRARWSKDGHDTRCALCTQETKRKAHEERLHSKRDGLNAEQLSALTPEQAYLYCMISATPNMTARQIVDNSNGYVTDEILYPSLTVLTKARMIYPIRIGGVMQYVVNR